MIVPVVGFEVRLLEGGRIFLENVFHVRGVDETRLDRRVVLLDFEGCVLRRIGLFDGFGDSDEVVFLHPISVCQLGPFLVEIQLEKERSTGKCQKHVDKNVQKFTHNL